MSEPSVPRRLLPACPSPAVILLVNPQALARRGVALTLGALHPDALILQAASFAEARQLLDQRADVALVVLDLDFIGDGAAGNRGRMAIIQHFARRALPIVVMASSRHPGDILACIRAGARAYVAKTGGSSVLEHAVALACVEARSELPCVPVPRTALERAPPGESPDGQARALDRLSGRQREIFQLLVAGRSNKEIARDLGVLEGTVKVHVRAVMQKLGVRNRTQVALAAVRHITLLGQDAADAGRLVDGTRGTGAARAR